VIFHDILDWTLAGVYLLAAIVALFLLAFAWRHRDTSSMTGGFMVVLGGEAAWAIAELVTMVFMGHPSTWGVAHAAQLSVIPMAAVVVVGLWCTSRAIADPEWHPTRRVALLLVPHPLAMMVAAAGPWHDALLGVRPPETPGRWVILHNGWIFWCHAALSHSLIIWALLHMLRAVERTNRLGRRHMITIFFAAAVPAAANIASIASTTFSPGSMPELTGVAFVVSSGIGVRAVFGQQWLRVVPVARGRVLDRLPDALVVTDGAGRLLDVNRAGALLLGTLASAPPDDLLGSPLTPILRDAGLPDPPVDGEYSLGLPTGPGTVELRTEELLDHKGRRIARILIIRDITELHAERRANEELRAALARQATTDALTGLTNRRHLLTQLEEELARIEERGDLCLVLLDIDHFKSVNDEHGHLTGDRLLVAIAHELTQGVRDRDVVARYGGEEFVILLPSTTVEQAWTRADELRRRCGQVSVPGPHGPVSRTVSMGIAQAAEVARAAAAVGSGLTSEVLHQSADDALYAAKAAGRDHVVLACP
jgi:diguanylate cyclase (GGDEF)-like protein